MQGKIIVRDCVLGASHDDAINVHGTHLRIVDQPAPNKITVRFMHPQTFGFDAFAVGTGLTTFPARRWFLTPPIPFPVSKSSMRRK